MSTSSDSITMTSGVLSSGTSASTTSTVLPLSATNSGKILREGNGVVVRWVGNFFSLPVWVSSNHALNIPRRY